MIKAHYLLMLVVLCTGCSTGPERTVYRSGTSHLPLLDERVLRYQELGGSEPRAYTMTLLYAGGHQSKVYTWHVKGAEFGDCDYICRDSSVFFGTSEPLTTLEPRGMLPEYRELWVDENARHGDTWENEDTGTQTVYAGRETVGVPAGTYTDCYKTVTEAMPALFDSLTAWRDRGLLTPAAYERELVNAKLVVVRWFAPGVGLVREQIGHDIIRALTKVEKVGKGEIDTTRVVPVPLEEG